MGFKKLDNEDFVVSSNSVTSTVFSNNQPSLNEFFTSSAQEESSTGDYYLNVFQTSSGLDGASVQFAIAYGNRNGGGSLDFDSAVPGVSPTKTIFGQYRTLVLEDENAQFVFGTSFSGSDFYAISLDRARYKEKLFPGSLNLVLSASNSTPGFTELHLTDNSKDVSLPAFFGTQRAFQIVSGSNGNAYSGTGFSPESGSYGLFLPDIATLILNASALNDSGSGYGIGLGTDVSANTDSNNNQKLFNHISGSSGDADNNIFKLNSQETLTSDFVFVRARNSEFNYTENPSFISGSTGEVVYNYFIDNPQVYATTVGLYNDSNDLLAVAKLSKPLVKDFTKEALVRVKLDF